MRALWERASFLGMHSNISAAPLWPPKFGFYHKLQSDCWEAIVKLTGGYRLHNGKDGGASLKQQDHCEDRGAKMVAVGSG